MPYLWRIFVIILLIIPQTAFAGDSLLTHADRVGKIDHLVESAISRGLIAGGVVLVGNRHGVLFERSYGRVSSLPDARPMTVDAIFDIASLTKVIATTPSILKLAEERKISLVDPLVKWFPEFAGKGKDDLLVLNLLTHTSGLDDFPLSAVNPLSSAIEGAASQKVKGGIGSRFKYADINFILLGEMVKRATGVGLDAYAASHFFAPLGMKDTTFNPDREKIERCTATLLSNRTLMVGHAQDYLARQLGGVAGHAGLFSTAYDLSRFCRMILNEGVFEGGVVLSQRAVRQMTAPYFSRGGSVVRGLGWDIASPYSSPKGGGFSEISFGHTGYSGSSIWIDPETDLFVVLLTSRLEYRKIREFSQLRSDISTLAAELFAASTHVGDVAFSRYDRLINPGK